MRKRAARKHIRRRRNPGGTGLKARDVLIGSGALLATAFVGKRYILPALVEPGMTLGDVAGIAIAVAGAQAVVGWVVGRYSPAAGLALAAGGISGAAFLALDPPTVDGKGGEARSLSAPLATASLPLGSMRGFTPDYSDFTPEGLVDDDA